MGLFDFLSGKPEDDEDEDLLAADPFPAKPKPEPAAKPAEPAPKPAPQATAKPAAQAPAKKQAKADDMPDFGIQKAIELMRDLPQQNVELVVQVVKKTLESMEVDVATIIDDAKNKQAKIQGRIKGLEEEIAEYKEEIEAREEEIKALKSDFSETRTVRERLEMAQKGVTPKAVIPNDVMAPATGKPAAAPPVRAAGSGEFKKPG